MKTRQSTIIGYTSTNRKTYMDRHTYNIIKMAIFNKHTYLGGMKEVKTENGLDWFPLTAPGVEDMLIHMIYRHVEHIPIFDKSITLKILYSQIVQIINN